MRASTLASVLVLSSAAILLPATASAGSYGGGSSFGSSSSASSSTRSPSFSPSFVSSNASSSNASRGSGYSLDRKGSIGIGNLRVFTGGWKAGSNGEQRRTVGVGWISKDGSNVKGLMKSEFKADKMSGAGKTSTAGSTTVKGSAMNSSWASHTAGKDGSSITTHGREISDKEGSHSQQTSASSNGHVTGSSTTIANGREHATSYDRANGVTTKTTSTLHADGSTSASHETHNANTGKTDRSFAATRADGVTEQRGSSITANGQVRTWQSRQEGGLSVTRGEAKFAGGGASSSFTRVDDLRGGGSWRSYTANSGNQTFQRSSMDAKNLNGDRVVKVSQSTTTTYPKGGPSEASARNSSGGASSGPIYVKSERVASEPSAAKPESSSGASNAPLALPAGASSTRLALPPGASSVNKHVAGKEGGVSVKDTIAKATANKHAEGKEGGVSVKDTIAKVTEGGGTTGRHSAPEQGPKHAAAE